MAKTIPDDVAASLSFLESSANTAKPLDKIPAAPIIRKDITQQKTGIPDDVAASLAVLEGKPVPEFQPVDTGPTPRQVEADVLGLAIRKGIKSDTALAAHRRDVAAKTGVNPGLVTPQVEDTAFYKEHDPEDLIKNFPAVAKYLGVQGNSELVGKDIGHLKTLETFFRSATEDTPIMLAKGLTMLTQSAVGIADLNPADLGGLGKTLEANGIDFPKISKTLTDMYTPEMQAALKEVENAKGFLGTIEAAVKNPAAVVELVGVSLPSMYLGSVYARALMPFVPAAVAVPIGEGLTMAGSAAEQIRTQSPDKELDAKGAALAWGTGVIGTLISAAGAQFAQRIGIEDPDILLATGKLREKVIGKMQQSNVPLSLAARLAGGFVSEGIVEELPQGVTEQIFQNIALGKPWDEGVPEAAALSIVTGGTMGAAVQAGVPARKQGASTDDALKKAADAHLNNIGKAVSAEEQQAALQKWSEEIVNNKLRKESPSAFKEFVKTMADEHSGIKEVFVDAKHLEESLQQSGIKPEEFIKNMPVVARDLQTALATGGEVRIPIEDYATYLAGSKLEPMILNQLRTDPEGMTYSESQTFFQQQKEIFAEKAKEIINTTQPVLTREEFAAKPQNDGKDYTEYLKAHENKVEAFARDAQEVHDKILTGMNSAKRFNRAVNAVYAVPFREFYAVNAAKEGILPSELYTRLPLNFSKMQIEDGGLEQSAKNQKIDADYLKAVADGDMVRAQEMVYEAAKDKGYLSGSEYRMMHQAPNREDYNLATIKDAGIVPDDYWTHPHYYQNDVTERNSFYTVNRALEKKARSIAVFRSVPKNVKDDFIRNGDWVSPSREYAKLEGESIPGGYRIIAQRVELKDLWWDANSINELGYDDGKEYAYKNTKNNRKLLDAVTYDDEGNVVPLSKRFNSRAYDTFFQTAKLPETLNVDGIERTTLNSEGRPIYPTEEGIRNFWKWFGDSESRQWPTSSRGDRKMAPPLVFYHGTKGDFNEFVVGSPGANSNEFGTWDTRRAGMFFTQDKKFAEGFSVQGGSARDANVMPVYLKMRNVIDLTKGFIDDVVIEALTEKGINPRLMRNISTDQIWGMFDEEDEGSFFVSKLKELGYDGAVIVERDPDTDENVESWIAFDPDQIKSAIGNNGDFSSDPNILKQSAFYSALEREIPNLRKVAGKDGNIKPEQAKSWIEARQKEGKFKKEEIEAVGLMDWLDTQEGKVPVADIENFVRENGVRIDETVLGGTATPIAVQEYEDQPEIYTLYRSDDPEGQNYGSLGEIIQIEDGQYEINVPGFTGRVTFDTLQEALERVSRGSSQFSETKFDNYVLPGGGNYRELLLTLPAKKFAASQEVRKLDSGRWGLFSGGERIQSYKTEEEARAAIIPQAVTADVRFRSSHFNQPNILAHVRVNERKANGQKVLFVEEIQSDWAQQGRDKGFASLTPQEQEELRALDGKAKELGDKVYTVSVSKRTTIEAELLTVNKRRAELREKVRGSTPSGPFVQNTKSWTALAVKRLMRYAAENGFDKIAWTTGEQQAARYDLSKQIQSIEARRGTGDTYDIQVFDNNEEKVLAGNYTKDKLPDVIGKEIANKVVELVETEDKPVTALPDGYDISLDPQSDKDRPFTVIPPGQLHGKPFTGRYATEDEAVQAALERINRERDYPVKLEGLDLKVGGEGMKAFYDGIVPQVVNDVSKKLGGGKVTPLNMTGETKNILRTVEGEDGKLRVFQESAGMYLKNPTTGVWTSSENRAATFDTYAEAQDAIAQHELPTDPSKAGEQPSLDITPEMRDKIMQGLPLFQGNRAGFNPNTFTMTLLDGSDLSSVIHEGGHFYLEALNEMATRPEAPQQIKDDFRKTLEWFGITGNEVGMPGGSLLDQKAFHGSPHDHNKFDTSKIGTGEGAQAYGYGHYFAESRDVAEFYKEKLTTGENYVNGELLNTDVPEHYLAYILNQESGNVENTRESLLDVANYGGSKSIKAVARDALSLLDNGDRPVLEYKKEKGRLYEVELAPEQDEYLLWDKPLSEQSDKVKAALGELPTTKVNPDGMDMGGGSVIRDNRNGKIKPGSSAPWILVSGDSRFDLTQKDVDRMTKDLGTDSTGENVYSRLTSTKGSQRAASEYLHSLGIRGIKYLDGSSRAKGEGAYNYVIFSDEDITITDRYYQGGETPQPGQLPPGRTPEEIWNNMTLDQKRPYHEQWAQSWERYALEGKAPTLEMQPVFARFRAWMLNIYKSMKEFLRNNPLAGKLNDDIRAVFDRLIASDEAIAEAQKARSYAPLFATSEEAGVTDKQFQEYVDEGRRSADEATSELDARSVRDMKWLTGARTKALKSLQNEARTKRKMLRTEVEQDIAQEPVERAKSYFAKGEYVNEDGQVIEAEVKAKLNKAEVLELMPNVDMKKLRGMTSEDGIALDLAAQLTGFSSGEALINALNDSEPTRDKVAAEVDKRMLEQYGDLVDDNALSAAADEAVHNEARARFMATGLKMLLKTSATSSQLVKAARQAAEQAIAGKAIRDIRPGQYARAETKANKEALKRAPKDRAGAAEAQRAALLNNKLYSVARDAKNEVDSILKYVRKFDNRKLGKVIHHDYLEQIVDLLKPFEFKNLPLREVDKNKSLTAWIEEQEANGFQPAIDVDTIEKSKLKNYKDMTLEELRGLKDTIKQIEHLGRYKDKLLTAKDRKEFNERIAEAEYSIHENANRTVEERATPTDTLGKTGQWFRQMTAGHRKFSSIIREMDGGKDNGTMWNLLARAMNEAGDMETEMRQQAAEKVASLFKMIKLDQGFMNLSAKKRLVPGTDISMTHEQRIMFAMNWGNEGNRQRLLDGGITGRRALSITQAQSILDTLTKPEWDFVQATWYYVGTYKEQIAALERKMTGVEPLWIEPATVTTKFGVYPGGYFPAKYDAELSTRSESLEAVTDLRMGMKGAFGAAATRNGYTQERSKQVIGRPLLLSFNVIPQHINEVIHRLSWQPWLTDANRVLRHLDSPIREHYGTEILREMRDTVMDIATGDAPAKNATEAAINRLRMGSTIVGMGWRVTTALLQPSGLAQSYVRVGPKWVSQGILQFLTSPNDSAEFADSRSTFMKNRATTMNREINEVLNTLRTGEGVSNLTASYFWLIGKMQRTVDIPTWIGAYNKGLAEVGYENAVDETQRKTMEEHAVRLADQAVIDSQSSGMTKDLARVQRGSPLNKILTNFYSYFSATYNLNIETVRKTNFMKPAEVMLMANNLIVLNVIPVLFAVALKESIKGNCGDDLECWAKKLANEQISYMLGQMILLREIGAAVGVATGGDQYGYQGPAGLRFFGDLYKAGVQVNQGEADLPMFKSLNNVAGAVLHYPAGQINNTVEGIMAVENGDVEGASILPALLFGPPKD